MSTPTTCGVCCPVSRQRRSDDPGPAR
jgi:hypothetical protein